MSSTFHGLEVAKRGMYTQQSALYTTGHNISNANTPGYSRQRVNFEQTAPFPPASRNRPEIPGQVGSGVKAGTIQRVREGFLDDQFRAENTKTGYWSAKSEALEKMEEIMNEPSENGLSKTMDRFWQSLQDLAVNPEDEGARSVVRQRGVAVAETFNYLSDSLKGIQSDFKNQIGVANKEINSIANQIKNLNDQIGEVEPHGYLPNDLYDERDRLIDELSQLVDVKVTNTKSSESSLEIAEGKVTIEILNSNGKPMFTDGSSNSVPLVDGEGNAFNKLHIEENGDQGSVSEISLVPSSTNLSNNATVADSEKLAETNDIASFSSGKLKGMISSFGYEDNGEAKGVFPDMLKELDKMAYSFANTFNTVHDSGYTIPEIESESDSPVANPFFDVKENETFQQEGYASNIVVAEKIRENTDYIAAASTFAKGDGDNALALADAGENLDIDVDGNPDNVSFKSYYEGVIGQMAVEAQESQRLETNSETLRQSVEERRQSVSGVSLDEEMSNMIKYQHAYNAAARNLTTIDEMLDRIINGMGRVGR